MWSVVTQMVDLGSWTAAVWVWVMLGPMVMLGAAVMDSFMAQAGMATRRSLKTFILKFLLDGYLCQRCWYVV